MTILCDDCYNKHCHCKQCIKLEDFSKCGKNCGFQSTITCEGFEKGYNPCEPIKVSK